MSHSIDFTTYSTSQEVACGTWIDGKTIYKKTINFGTLPNSTNKTVAHNISGFGDLVKIDGVAYNSNTGNYFPITFNDSTRCAVAYANATNVVVFTNSDLTQYKAYISICYTKS